MNGESTMFVEVPPTLRRPHSLRETCPSINKLEETTPRYVATQRSFGTLGSIKVAGSRLNGKVGPADEVKFRR